MDSSFPLNSRNIRILEYLEKKHKVLAVTWDRKSSTNQDVYGYKIFKKNSEYGKKIRKLLNLPKFYFFVKNNVLDFKPDVIIASNWDMLIVAVLIKIRYNVILIYENRDMVSSKYIVIKYILEVLERLALCYTDGMIVASRFFSGHYKQFKGEIVELENKVSSNIKIENNISSEKFRISFIGTVRFYNIMINLIDALKDMKNLELNIYGDGPDRINIENYICNNNIENVNIYGAFIYSEIGKYYSKTDILWSVYPNTENSNKKYVVPNKYYESLYFNVPGIFPNKTKLGDLVLKQDIGFVVDPYSVEDIKCLLYKISNDRNLISDKIKRLKLYKEEIIFENDVVKIEKLIGSEFNENSNKISK